MSESKFPSPREFDRAEETVNNWYEGLAESAAENKGYTRSYAEYMRLEAAFVRQAMAAGATNATLRVLEAALKARQEWFGNP